MYNSKKKWWALVIIFVLIISIGGAYYVSITTTWVVTLPHGRPSVTLDLPLDDNVSTVNPVLFNWTSTDNDTAPGDLEHMWFLDLIPTMNTPYKITTDMGNLTSYNYTFLLGGTYYWKVEVTDGDTVNASEIRTIIFDMHPGNHVPMLTNISLIPSYGNVDTIFNYTVKYADLDNDSPDNIEVWIDGTCYNMNAVNVSDTNYSDGKLYCYNTLLSPGIHNYSFYCADAYSANATQLFQGPDVVLNHQPQITLYNPIPGQVFLTSNVTFNFSVIDVDDNLLYYEVWLTKDNGSKQLYNIESNTTLSLFVGTYRWQVYAVDVYGGNLSEERTFGVLASGKQTSVTIQVDDNSVTADASFTGNLVITNEGPNPSYEVYWYVYLYNVDKNKQFIYDSGSKAISTSVEVTFEILLDNEYEPDNYYLVAYTYDAPYPAGAMLGQDEVLVSITSQTVPEDDLKVAWYSLIYDTPRFIVDLSEYTSATQVAVPDSYVYQFLFFSGVRSLTSVEIYLYYGNVVQQIPVVIVTQGVYSFGDIDEGILIIVPNPSVTDCSWILNWLHKSDFIMS